MLFGSPLSFGSFVLAVVIAQVSTLHIFRSALRFGFRFRGTRLIQVGLYVHVRVLLQRVNIPTLPI